MLKRALLLIALALPLLAAALAPRVLAQGAATLVASVRIPSSNDLKIPHVDTIDRTVYVSYNADRSTARLITKQDSAGSFGSSRVMGDAEGPPQYNSAAVFTAADGTIYYAWSNYATKRVALRIKAPGAADFGPERLVTGSSPLPVEVEVAANEDGVFVFWREPDRPLKYRRSTDGVNWAVPTQTLGSVTIQPNIEVAGGSGRRLAVAFTRGFNDKLQGYVAVWNSATASLGIERIPTVPDQDFADPTITFLPDGTLSAAVRSTDELDTCCDGMYAYDRLPNGQWTNATYLVKGGTKFVAMDADQLGNIHLAWINVPSGNDLWYTTRRAGGAFSSNLIRINVGTQPLFNVRAAANLSDRSYGHFVAEQFIGSVPVGQYFAFGLPVNATGAQGITIEGGATTTNKAAVAVEFAGVTGSPSEVRWRWGAPPTDAANDSGGYKPFASPLSVPAPTLADPNACTTATLYTQLKGASGVQGTPNSDSIVIDRAVQAGFGARSPYAGFDSAYTRVPTATVSISAAGECAGLASASVSGPISGGTLTPDVVGKPTLEVDVGLTGDAGAKTLSLNASDLLGNTGALSDAVTYDPNPPTFTDPGGPVVVTSEADATTLVDITLTDAVATDDLRLYGLIVTPTLTPAGGGDPVAGEPIVVPFSDMNQFSVDQTSGKLTLRFSLDLAESILPARLVAGRYDLTIRMADAAGNQSAGSALGSIDLTAISYSSNLPLIKR